MIADATTAGPACRRSFIQAQFEQFHRDNPRVYKSLVRRTRMLKAKGRKRISIAMLFEVLRWHYYMSVQGDQEFALNNNFRSRYARLIMDEHPELEGIFDTRQLTEGGAA